MKHTELYSAYKALDRHEELELIEAVKAHGGEYIFIHKTEDEEIIDVEEQRDAPIISASSKWEGSYKDYRVSRLEVTNVNGTDILTVYGWPVDPNWPDEEEIDTMAHGSMGYIISEIKPTENVSDVTIPLVLKWS